MDRRTKIILLIIGSILLLGLVFWFIVWPTLRPILPERLTNQPPTLPDRLSPPTGQNTIPTSAPTTPPPSDAGIATFEPVAEANPDARIIADLSRRAGILAERVESGSNADGFSNLADAALDVSSSLAAKFQAMRTELLRVHPASGVSYLTIARRLVERPESERITGPTFKIMVQLQVQERTDGVDKTLYREATVVFVRAADQWIPTSYESKEISNS